MQIYPNMNFIGFVVIDSIFILAAGIMTVFYYLYVTGYFSQAKKRLARFLPK